MDGVGARKRSRIGAVGPRSPTYTDNLGLVLQGSRLRCGDRQTDDAEEPRGLTGQGELVSLTYPGPVRQDPQGPGDGTDGPSKRKDDGWRPRGEGQGSAREDQAKVRTCSYLPAGAPRRGLCTAQWKVDGGQLRTQRYKRQGIKTVGKARETTAAAQPARQDGGRLGREGRTLPLVDGPVPLRQDEEWRTARRMLTSHKAKARPR
ncbi:hypothetical protein A4X13_0g8571 [Tilletia indica]|uniref:Uncharacterized protein n=1 Tax=Tilletia indica TaxID=43049 RepID=A0A8T8SE35_9BASI|nr:hypothetical protein A4X13_0g8571 [Tilletia indica]